MKSYSNQTGIERRLSSQKDGINPLIRTSANIENFYVNCELFRLDSVLI